ncbi:Asp23/Gls24 family envelope stress response protein [Peptococcus simiae]|uniref:Asp23/Gls24 family envelope stress response protein n=1 Tax=Peptococcus simiae TaxID=1643805 RepID=A0ABW9GWK6_9FIRM
MDVYALIGPSGTGKSHHAMEVAQQYDIEYIIDDGLLIHRGKKIAGQSAKAEPTLVAAVKTAIFLDPKAAADMRETLQKENPKKLLLLGTSEHMIDRVGQSLNLPPLKQIIFIHNVVSPEEIQLAQQMRQEGKHVIPLPAVEVRQNFPGIWIRPFKDLFKRKKGKDQPSEKSIVRPRFSQFGQVSISEQVVIQLVNHLAKQHERLGQGVKTGVNISDLGVTIQCEATVRFGTPIQLAVQAFQEEAIQTVEHITGLTVRSIDVRITGIYKD